MIGQLVSEIFMLESVDRRMEAQTNGRRLESHTNNYKLPRSLPL